MILRSILSHLLLSCLFLLSSGRKRKLFKSQEIIEMQNDPNIDTRDNEYIVSFQLNCLKQMKRQQRDIIQEFLDLFQCYQVNDEEPDLFPEIIDHWIRMDKIFGCNDDDDIEIQFDDYCLRYIEPNANFKLQNANDCVMKEIIDTELWNLDQGTSSSPGYMAYMDYDSEFDPDFDIIVFDSGIDYTHSEFDNITYQILYDPFPQQSPTEIDPHGTHVTGTILGKTYGVFQANKIKNFVLYDVAIFSIFGNTTSEFVLNAYDSVINHLQSTQRKAIINHSWGGPKSFEQEVRLRAINDLGSINVAAAGNYNWPASWFSPANSNSSITVGAHDDANKRSQWSDIYQSNYGDAVDVWAPGSNVKSAVPNNGHAIWGGTSMAAPFVTGIVANIWANHQDLDFDGIKQRLLDYAIYDIDDRLGSTQLPRAQIECEEYEPPTLYPTVSGEFYMCPELSLPDRIAIDVILLVDTDGGYLNANGKSKQAQCNKQQSAIADTLVTIKGIEDVQGTDYPKSRVAYIEFNKNGVADIISLTDTDLNGQGNDVTTTEIKQYYAMIDARCNEIYDATNVCDDTEPTQLYQALEYVQDNVYDIGNILLGRERYIIIFNNCRLQQTKIDEICDDFSNFLEDNNIVVMMINQGSDGFSSTPIVDDYILCLTQNDDDLIYTSTTRNQESFGQYGLEEVIVDNICVDSSMSTALTIWNIFDDHFDLIVEISVIGAILVTLINFCLCLNNVGNDKGKRRRDGYSYVKNKDYALSDKM